MIDDRQHKKTPKSKDERTVHGSNKGADSSVIFSSDREPVPNRYLKRGVLENEGDFDLFNRGKVFFKDLNIEDIVGLISQETDGLTEKNDSRHMRSRRKTKCNAESFDRPMGLSRILLDNNGDVLCHEK